MILLCKICDHGVTGVTCVTQLNYADMLKRVDPLRSELKDLEHRAETTRVKGEEIKKIVFDLEESIAKYKEEYAILISEANAIKADLSTVEAKVLLLVVIVVVVVIAVKIDFFPQLRESVKIKSLVYLSIHFAPPHFTPSISHSRPLDLPILPPQSPTPHSTIHPLPNPTPSSPSPSLRRLSVARPSWGALVLSESAGTLAVRPSRARWPPSVEMSC